VTAQACQHHPEQAAVGICVRCGAPFCDACLTKLDDINHCRPCLDLLARRAARVDSARAASGEANGEAGLEGQSDLHEGKRGTRTARPSARARPGLAWLVLGLSLVLLAALALSTLDAVLPAGAP
jgi:hypothetical protein